MAAPALALSPDGFPASNTDPCVASVLLAIVERSLHALRSEWLFFRELRVGTARRNGNVQRLDAFALNSLPHTAMKRVCYEVKASRSDFLAELKHPLKRRIGMRYSNEFYFVTPAQLVDITEIPAECGLVEAGVATADEWKRLIRRQAGFFSFDPDTRQYCMITVPAPWRDTPGPTWQLVAAMLRHQRRELEERPPTPPSQQRLTFA
ncbi:MAG TPA: hypothetical protein VMR62_17790 [Bryobacteraceae bacterium]|nr:hypothetical protein [Bryobacteraceae bacterium]